MFEKLMTRLAFILFGIMIFMALTNTAKADTALIYHSSYSDAHTNVKEQLEAERNSIEQERLRVAEDLSKAGAEHSPDIYDQVAQRFEDEGEPELAEQARQMAEESRNRKQSASKTVEVEKFKREWSESVSKMSEQNPELKDADSELFKAVKYLLDNKPALTTYSTGFQDAVEVAKYYVDSQNLERITIENKKLKTEWNLIGKKLN